jgi:site-specific recombinase XerC
LTFNRAVVVRYRSYLESLGLSAATINLRLSAIRRLADESAESGWLTPELAIGIRRVQGVKRLGRRSGNWLTRNQAQVLVNAASQTDLRGWRDGAILGLLLGCGLRRSEVVGLTLDQLQTRVDLIGKDDGCEQFRGGVVQAACGCLAPAFGRERRPIIQAGFQIREAARGWRYGKRCLVRRQTVRRAGGHPTSGAARSASYLCLLCHDCTGELEQIRFPLGHASVQTTERYIGSKQKLQDAVNDRLGISVTSNSG